MTQTSGASRREIADARLQRCLKIEIGNLRDRAAHIHVWSLRRLPLTPTLPERASLVSTPRKGGAREKGAIEAGAPTAWLSHFQQDFCSTVRCLTVAALAEM